MKYIATIVAAIALAPAASAELFYYVGQGGANLQSPASYRVGSRDGAGWTVKAGGQVKSKWSARITATGIHVSKPGTSLFFRRFSQAV